MNQVARQSRNPTQFRTKDNKLNHAHFLILGVAQMGITYDTDSVCVTMPSALAAVA